METKICIFKDSTITFNLSKDNGMMINATEMAKAFNESIEHITRLDGTEKFIKECLENPHLGYLNFKKETDIIFSRQNVGMTCICSNYY